MDANKNKETVLRIYDALSRGDQSEFERAVHSHYVWHIAGRSTWSRSFFGREAIERDLLSPLFSLFASRYTAQASNIIAEGDYVVAEVRGDVKTKRVDRYDNSYCFIFRFEGDLIAEVTEYCDTDLIERVLGPFEDAHAGSANTA